MSDSDPHHANADLDRIKRQAADWLIAQDRGFEPEEQDAFFQWLAEDARHGDAYHSRARTWRRLDALADWRPEHSLEPNPDLLAAPPPRAPRRRLLPLLALAAGLAAAALVPLAFHLNAPERSIALAQGAFAAGYERHVLQDGSVVELNRGAQVTVRYSKAQRAIDLLSGEAHFTVAKDPRRPFVVQANRAVVQAVGTVFNVALQQDEVEVLVTEGRVLVNPIVNAKRDIAIEPSEPLARELGAGQRSVVPLRSQSSLPTVENLDEATIERRLEWRFAPYDFTAAPLAEVVSAFNRRHGTQLQIADPALHAIEITAALRLDNVDDFIGILEFTQNIEADRSDPQRIKLRSKR